MGIFNTGLAMDPVNNPLVHSPFDQGNSNIIPPPGDALDLVTEDGMFILTEAGDFLTTE
jgi:hypothetical protein